MEINNPYLINIIKAYDLEHASLHRIGRIAGNIIYDMEAIPHPAAQENGGTCIMSKAGFEHYKKGGKLSVEHVFGRQASGEKVAKSGITEKNINGLYVLFQVRILH